MAAGDHLDELRELVEFLKANDIAEFSMKKADLEVDLKFTSAIVHPAPANMGLDPAVLAQMLANAGGGGAASPASLPAAPMPHAPAAGGEAAAPAAAAVADPLAGAHVLTSPIVGTFYASPAPDAEAFVKVGDKVKRGQVLCIVEAMKLMNEIESDVDGEVVKMFVESGQPVEYGQSLFAIR